MTTWRKDPEPPPHIKVFALGGERCLWCHDYINPKMEPWAFDPRSAQGIVHARCVQPSKVAQRLEKT